jgi:hypothetical protein
VKIYWANLFSWAESAKKGQFIGDGTRPAPGAGWAVRPDPTGPVGPRWRFAPVFPRFAPFRLPSLLRKFKGKFE